MPEITFNKLHFFRTVIIFLFLTVGWTFLCIQADEFNQWSKGFIIGLGFLLLFPISIYFGQERKKLTSLIYAALITITVFLIGTFIIGPIVGAATNSMVLYAIVNSLFVSFAMTVSINRIYGIKFRYLTIGMTFILLICSYYLIDKFSNSIYLTYDISPALTMFNIFQLLLLIPLTLGMTLSKARAQEEIAR